MFDKKRLYASKKPRSIVALVLACVIFSALITITVSKSLDVIIQNSGRITVIGLEAYGGDISSANGDFLVDWGTIYVGSSRSVLFYLRSVSNVPTTLIFSVDNWEPKGLEAYMHISWNYSGTQVAPGEEISVRIDLNPVYSADFVDYLITNNVNSYSFSLSIKAVGS